MFIIISVLFDVILTCDQLMLYKRTDGPPVRQRRQSPTEASGSLNLCGHWCIGPRNCYAVSWEPGSCVEVGPFNNGAVVNTSIYIVQYDHNINGKQSSCCLLLVSNVKKKKKLPAFGFLIFVPISNAEMGNK